MVTAATIARKHAIYLDTMQIPLCYVLPFQQAPIGITFIILNCNLVNSKSPFCFILHSVSSIRFRFITCPSSAVAPSTSIIPHLCTQEHQVLIHQIQVKERYTILNGIFFYARPYITGEGIPGRCIKVTQYSLLTKFMCA